MNLLQQLQHAQSLSQKALDASQRGDWAEVQSNIDLRDNQLHSTLPLLANINQHQITEAKTLLESINTINTELNTLAKQSRDKLAHDHSTLNKSQNAINRYLDNASK